jgi:HK97 family phage major capsid protein
MAVTTKELRSERDKLVKRSREIYETAAKDKRALNTEERSEYDKIVGVKDADGKETPGAIDELDDAIYQLEKVEKAEQRSAAGVGRVTAPEVPGTGKTPDKTVEDGEEPQTGTNSPEYRSAFKSWMRYGDRRLKNEEYRALAADNDSTGGFLVAPQQFLNTIILFVKDRVFLRQLGTVYQIDKAESLGAPSLDTDPADSNWTGEIQTGTEDSSMKLGKRELRPHPLAKLIKISRTLLERATVGAEGLVKDRLGYKFAIAEEKGFMTGSGANQPLGVFTASSNGIDTSRDVTCSSTTAFSADDLITAKYTLKQQYMESPSTRWLFHRDGIRKTRQLKDGIGQYLWRSGIAGDKGDTILEVPFVMSEYAPNTFTTGLYVGMIGDFSNYWIADALPFRLQRLDELYAATNQVGFIGRKETDAMPVLAEAFARLKLA